MWKIDTLDPRGGLAFASCRNTYLADDATLGAGRGSVFIGPPHFRPEPVANRSLALAASRGGCFQTGLYIRDGVEASFRSVTEISEFVRRTFVRGGGGDEPGGGGSEIPPPELPLEPLGWIEPDGERGERKENVERLKQPERRLSEVFSDSLKAFHNQIGRRQDGAKETPWSAQLRTGSGEDLNMAAGAGFRDGPELLAAGAVRMIHEMMRRWPVSGDPMAVLRWERNALRLGRLIDRVGVYPLVFSRYVSVLDDCFRQVFERLGRGFEAWWHLYYPSVPERMVPTLLTLLFRLGVPLDVDESRLDELLRRRIDRDYDRFTLWNLSQGDPVSDLANLPCPQGFEKLMGRKTGELVTLYNFLTSFLGSPSVPGGSERGVLELVLFAGAAIVGHEGSASLHPGHRWWDRSIAPSEMEALKLLAGETWLWLAEHLPQLAFPREIEEAIQSASGLRYAS